MPDVHRRHYKTILPEPLKQRLTETVAELNQVHRDDRLWRITSSLEPALIPTCNFYETFFSNAIEGSSLNVQETHAVLFERQPLPKKLRKRWDAIQMCNHHELLQHPDLSLTITNNADIWSQAICQTHAHLMRDITNNQPGQFIQERDRMVAGTTQFLSPEHRDEMLHHVQAAGANCPPGIPRAAVWLVGFILVHPFVDGNGRTSRILANPELQRAGLSRFIMHFDARGNHIISMQNWYNHGGILQVVQRIAECQQRTQRYRWHPDIMTTEQYLRQDGDLMSKKKFRSINRKPILPPALPRPGA